MTGCDIVGPPGSIFTDAGQALRSVDSTVSVWRSTLTGGVGEGSSHGSDLPGGHGIVTLGGSLYLCDSEVRGGDGGSMPGGCGLVLGGLTRVLDSTFRGGPGRPRGSDVCDWGGTLENIDADPRALTMSAPNRYGSPMTVLFEGLPSDLVLLPHNLDPAYAYVPGGHGPFVIDPNGLLNFRIGILPASGRLQLQLNTPTLPGFEGLPFYSQGWFFDPTGLTLSAPTCTVLIDPQF